MSSQDALDVIASTYNQDIDSNTSLHQRDTFDKNKLSTKTQELDGDANNNNGEVHLRKSFSVWSILGVGFGLTNSWFGISASMVTGISSGGPMMVVYGIIIIALVSICIGTSLSELSLSLIHI